MFRALNIYGRCWLVLTASKAYQLSFVKTREIMAITGRIHEARFRNEQLIGY
jgi:hypothetical protein